MTDITPTMDDMIDCVCDAGAQGYTRAEFARFLNTVRADAWEEGHTSGEHDALTTVFHAMYPGTANPYRSPNADA